MYSVLYMYEINYYICTACCICMKSIIIYVQRVVYVCIYMYSVLYMYVYIYMYSVLYMYVYICTAVIIKILYHLKIQKKGI